MKISRDKTLVEFKPESPEEVKDLDGRPLASSLRSSVTKHQSTLGVDGVGHRSRTRRRNKYASVS